MPFVGMTYSGRCSRASRSARSSAKATPLANSALCTAALAAGWAAMTWTPRGGLLPDPSLSADA
ncbi:Uncharacterised protein [Mycobacterium tuberculosis]|nr:Uncharacterised protein [Mycobacterium tuberculosis]CKR82985.1 Uncharacterised protein [Mycobacterium tuberculosis]